MVIPKSLKLKYSSTKCRKSALKNINRQHQHPNHVLILVRQTEVDFYQRFCQICYLFCCCCIVCSFSKRWKLASLKLGSLRVHGSWCRANGKVSNVPTHTQDNLSYLQKEGNQYDTQHIHKKATKKIAADRRLQAKYHKNCCNPKALFHMNLNTFLKLRALCTPSLYQALHCKNCPSHFTIS